MDNQTATISRVFNRMAAAILDDNDLCPDETHRERMRRTVLDQLELGRRRVEEGLNDVREDV